MKRKIVPLFLVVCMCICLFAGVSFAETNEGIYTTVGSAIRTNNPSGQRFRGRISKAYIEENGITEFGMVLVPTAALGNDHSADDIRVDATLNGYPVAAVPANNIYEETETEYVYTAVLIGIVPQNYTREISARAYAKLGDGTYVYADGTARSIYDAAKLLVESSGGLSENALAYIQGILDYVEGVKIEINTVEPKEGVEAPTSVEVDGYEASIQWSYIGGMEHEGVFSGENYIGTITLTTETIFSPNDKVTWNGKTVTYTLSSDQKTMTIKKEFRLADYGWSDIV